MKKMWEEPRIQVQEFMPNEYVAVCWGVQCSVSDANKIEKNFYHNPSYSGITHSSAYCGQTSHQWLLDSDNNNIAEAMVEINTDGLGDLPCTIYTDATYKHTRDISTVRPDQYIYWTTSSGAKTWHHQGRVSNTVDGHPNRS